MRRDARRMGTLQSSHTSFSAAFVVATTVASPKDHCQRLRLSRCVCCADTFVLRSCPQTKCPSLLQMSQSPRVLAIFFRLSLIFQKAWQTLGSPLLLYNTARNLGKIVRAQPYFACAACRLSPSHTCYYDPLHRFSPSPHRPRAR